MCQRGNEHVRPPLRRHGEQGLMGCFGKRWHPTVRKSGIHFARLGGKLIIAVKHVAE